MRGTSRSEAGTDAIEAAGIEAARADPDRLASVVDLVGDVGVVAWLLGSASGPAEAVTLNGPRLESLLAHLVDTPVRGFLYEASGSAPPAALEAGARLVEAAAERWRIPVGLLRTSPDRPADWVDAAHRAASELVG